MQCIIEDKIMSFDFSNINPIKAQATYKDGGGLGGGGMYMRQGKKKRENEPDDDIFERRDDKKENEIDYEVDVKEEDIPDNTMFNKFVNWFRIGKD